MSINKEREKGRRGEGETERLRDIETQRQSGERKAESVESRKSFNSETP
jgi:hypothetical protein